MTCPVLLSSAQTQVVNQVNPVQPRYILEQPSLKPQVSCKAGHSSSAQFFKTSWQHMFKPTRPSLYQVDPV